MPRPLRIIYPNAWYHVMNRGPGRKNIFKNNLHRNLFLEILHEAHIMFGIQIHAYCLMDNHYHLLLTTPDANLSQAMRHINGVYTQRYNRLSKTDGPLFKGRYMAQLVEDDCYQLLLSRYIHLNPVKANMVVNAGDYKWSSYRAYLALAKRPAWLSTHVILEQIATRNSLQHVKNYKDYVEVKVLDEINVFSSRKHTDPIIGSTLFKDKILSQLDSNTTHASRPDINRIKTIPTVEMIIKQVCDFFNIDSILLFHTRRGQLNWPRLVCI